MLKPYQAIFITFLAATITQPAFSEDKKHKQLVIVSFDGAHDNNLWEKSRAIAQRTGARFTYFLSCTFLMTKGQRWAYQAPDQKKGRSNVGFAHTKTEVRERLNHIWEARNEGHEIGNHACGHFDGKNWSAAEWVKELTAFKTTLKAAWRSADAAEDEPAGWEAFARNDITGFRAPYLSTSGHLSAALRETGHTYDASGVSKGPSVPRISNRLSAFDLPLIPEGPRNRRVIAMDYNMFVRHSGGIENATKSEIYEERAYNAFRRAFDRQYNGPRRPLQIGLHFVEMNGGAYWRAMERLLTEVCGSEDVACVTYSEALDTLKARKSGGGGA
ncbi:polysaccharide deacetylase [Hoeflea sp. TYP-13]|uniref:polysaccharide deacetylase n=1 Tax=Hoeflea sp. TYP-13 TaxID=3230023 RepID=UPI0034C655B1